MLFLDKTLPSGAFVAPPPPPPPPAAITPAFTAGPSSRTVLEGSNTVFSATVSQGDLPVTVQFQKNNANVGSPIVISSGTLPQTVTYTHLAVNADNGAVFRAVATNAVGGATSATGTLTVTPVVVFSPYPEVGEEEAALIDSSQSFSKALGFLQHFDNGTSQGKGVNLRQINDTTGKLYGDGDVVLGRIVDPTDSSKSMFSMKLRDKDYNTSDIPGYSSNLYSERTQINWSYGTGGIDIQHIPRLDREYWAWLEFSLDNTTPWPTEMLIWQMHANKNTDSWGYYSPPFAIYLIDNGSGGTRLFLMYLHQRDASKRGLTPPQYGGPSQRFTLDNSLVANKKYRFIAHFYFTDSDEGYLEVWLNGVRTSIVTAGPTHYKCDSLELLPDRGWRTTHPAFITISLYKYRAYSGPLFERSIRFTSAGYRRHRPGMSLASISAKLDQHRRFVA